MTRRDPYVVARRSKESQARRPLGRPYEITKKSSHGRSVWVTDLNTQKGKAKYHINANKVFIKRNEHEAVPGEWKSMADISNEQRRWAQAWVVTERKRKAEEKRQAAISESRNPKVCYKGQTRLVEKYWKIPLADADYGSQHELRRVSLQRANLQHNFKFQTYTFLIEHLALRNNVGII